MKAVAGPLTAISSSPSQCSFACSVRQERPARATRLDHGMPRWKIKPTCIEPCRSRSAGFTYKSNIVWHKIRKDGGSDGRGVGFYFRNVTELVLFGVKGKNARTLKPGRTQVNYLATRKREHSRKPDELYSII